MHGTGVLSPWDPCMLGSHWQGLGHLSCLCSPLLPIPIPHFIDSLDLSELAKAAKKKLQAVSLLRQAPKTRNCPHLLAPRPCSCSPFP